MSTIAFKLVRGRVRNLEDAFEDILVESQEALECWEAEDIVQEVLGVVELAKRILSRRMKGMRPDTPPSEIASAHSTGFLLADIGRLVARAAQFAERYKRKGYSIKGLADLQLAHHEFPKLLREYSDKWMLPDAKKLKIARQEIAEGHYDIL